MLEVKLMKWEQWNKSRIDELLSLWNKELGDRFPMRKELFEQNSFDDINVNLEGSLIALNDEGRVIGFVVAKRWQDPIDVGISRAIGWIQVLLVDRDYRGEGIGTALLHHAEKELMRQGIHRVMLGRDTWHYFPGIPKEDKDACGWFEHKGYVAGWEEVDLYCKYKNVPVTIPAHNQVEISLATKRDRDSLVFFLHKCFPGRWEYEAIQYFGKSGSGREFVLLKKHGRIIGFCRINDAQSPFIAQNTYWESLVDGELGGVGPLGVDPSERKNGYGLLVVEAGIAYLRQRGVKSIVIDWTGLVDFYHKLGFEVWKRYISYQKEMV